MKNILVPTDFSGNCNKAANLAINLAALFNAEIHFLHQLKTPIDWVKLTKSNENKYPETLKKIGIAKSKLRVLDKEAEHKGLKSRVFLEFVSDLGAILEHSQNFHHDFIITGSKGIQNGFLNQLLGSNTQKIIRKAHVPILVVKEDSVVFPFENIVFVSDFKEDITVAFEEVEKIAKKCNAHIQLLNIVSQSDERSEEEVLKPIKTFVSQYGDLKNYSMHVYSAPNVWQGVKKFNKKNKVDLFAISTHSRKGLLSVFSKSIAEDLTNQSKTPVMTVHL